MAILGTPCKELDNDPKNHSDLQVYAPVHGEQITFCASATELLVLDVSEIPRCEKTITLGESNILGININQLLRMKKR